MNSKETLEQFKKEIDELHDTRYEFKPSDIKSFGFYNENAFKTALEQWEKYGYGKRNKSAKDDLDLITGSRPGQKPGLVGWNYMKGVGQFAGRLGRMGPFNVFGPVGTVLAGDMDDWYRAVTRGDADELPGNLYTEKGEKKPTIYGDDIAPNPEELWQFLRHYAFGWAGGTHYAASLGEALVESGQGLLYLGTQGANLAIDSLLQTTDDIFKTNYEDVIGLDQQEKFKEWLQKSLHYSFEQTPLAHDITDLMYGNRNQVEKVLRKYDILPSNELAEIKTDIEKDNELYRERGMTDNIVDDIDANAERRLRLKLQTNPYRYSEKDVYDLVQQLKTEYNRIKLSDKDTAQARQFFFGVLSQYTDSDEFIKTVRKNPGQFLLDAIDLWTTRGGVRTVRKLGQKAKQAKQFFKGTADEISDGINKQLRPEISPSGITPEGLEIEIPDLVTPEPRSITPTAKETPQRTTLPASGEFLGRHVTSPQEDIQMFLEQGDPTRGSIPAIERLEYFDDITPDELEQQLSNINNEMLIELSNIFDSADNRLTLINDEIDRRGLDEYGNAPVFLASERSDGTTQQRNPIRDGTPERTQAERLQTSIDEYESIYAELIEEGDVQAAENVRARIDEWRSQFEQLDIIEFSDDQLISMLSDWESPFDVDEPPIHFRDIETELARRGIDRDAQEQQMRQRWERQDRRRTPVSSIDDLDTMISDTRPEGPANILPHTRTRTQDVQMFEGYDNITLSEMIADLDIESRTGERANIPFTREQIETELNRRMSQDVQLPDGTTYGVMPEETSGQIRLEQDAGDIQGTGKKVSIEDIEAEILGEAADTADITPDDANSIIAALDETDDVLDRINELLTDDDDLIEMQAGFGIPGNKIKKFLETIRDNWKHKPEDFDKVVQDTAKAGISTAQEKAGRIQKETQKQLSKINKEIEKLGQLKPDTHGKRLTGMDWADRSPALDAVETGMRHFSETGKAIESAKATWTAYDKALKNFAEKKRMVSADKKGKTYNIDAAMAEETAKVIKTALDEANLTSTPEKITQQWERMRSGATSETAPFTILKRFREARKEVATNIEIENFLNKRLRNPDGAESKTGMMTMPFPKTRQLMEKYDIDILAPGRGQTRTTTITSNRADYPNRPAVQRMEGPMQAFLNKTHRSNQQRFGQETRRLKAQLSKDETITNHEIYKLLEKINVSASDILFYGNREWLQNQIARAGSTEELATVPGATGKERVQAARQRQERRQETLDAEVDEFVELIQAHPIYKEIENIEAKYFDEGTVHDFVQYWHTLYNTFEQLQDSAGPDHVDFADMIDAIEDDIMDFAYAKNDNGNLYRDREPVRKLIDGVVQVEDKLENSFSKELIKQVSEFKNDTDIYRFFTSTDATEVQNIMDFLFTNARKPRTAQLTDSRGRFTDKDPGQWTKKDYRDALKEFDAGNPDKWTPEQQQIVFRGFMLEQLFDDLRRQIQNQLDRRNIDQVEGGSTQNIHRFSEMLELIDGNDNRGVALFGETIWNELQGMKTNKALWHWLATKDPAKSGVVGGGLGVMGSATLAGFSPIEAAVAAGAGAASGIATVSYALRKAKSVPQHKEFFRKVKTDPSGEGLNLAKLLKQILIWQPEAKVVGRRTEKAMDRPERMYRFPEFNTNSQRDVREFLRQAR